ncbi:hypothetical protein MAPG_11247 [Magnaporthiopsis poae ATCC 64411]|uniref:Uncharacterized protein n=1 Tax=Magnaporthiopsis poae (strain ATCC 64411 / 73-15) TaxID=644358 RepID=A0A0C4EER8_MAGP6|nr:hypothetical protein MAPG_11247 [Magnaporthiopsis poae ATCC 64411]
MSLIHPNGMTGGAKMAAWSAGRGSSMWTFPAVDSSRPGMACCEKLSAKSRPGRTTPLTAKQTLGGQERRNETLTRSWIPQNENRLSPSAREPLPFRGRELMRGVLVLPSTPSMSRPPGNMI